MCWKKTAESALKRIAIASSSFYSLKKLERIFSASLWCFSLHLDWRLVNPADSDKITNQSIIHSKWTGLKSSETIFCSTLIDKDRVFKSEPYICELQHGYLINWHSSAIFQLYMILNYLYVHTNFRCCYVNVKLTVAVLSTRTWSET